MVTVHSMYVKKTHNIQYVILIMYMIKYICNMLSVDYLISYSLKYTFFSPESSLKVFDVGLKEWDRATRSSLMFKNVFFEVVYAVNKAINLSILESQTWLLFQASLPLIQIDF